MNKLLITGFLIFCMLNCFPTCIAVYIAPNGHIYVAADSRRTFLFNDGKETGKFESVCKIHHVGANYFAISGIDDASLLKGATNALQQNADIDTALERFKTAMIKHYTRLMTDMKAYYPEKFKHFLRNGLADVSFFGFYNGRPNVVNLEFLCDVDDHGKVVCAGRIHQIYALTVVGMSEDITNAKPEELPPHDLMEQAPELYVEALVKIEARKQPQAVSEPIDLLELSPGGEVWIRKNETAAVY